MISDTKVIELFVSLLLCCQTYLVYRPTFRRFSSFLRDVVMVAMTDRLVAARYGEEKRGAAPGAAPVRNSGCGRVWW